MIAFRPKLLKKEAKKLQDLADNMPDSGDWRRRGYITNYRERAELLRSLAENIQKLEDFEDE